MSDLTLSIGSTDYALIRPLIDGRVPIEGAHATYTSAPVVVEIFEKMIREHAYDVSELGMTYLLRTLEVDPGAFVALPVFPNRQFRHSAVYVNTHAGIRSPRDLTGRTIGELAIYGHDSGVATKGILAEEYGVSFEGCHWVVGGLDFPLGTIDFIPQPHPDGVQVTHAPSGRELGEMLDAGDLDALISADVPRCVLDGSPNVARLFPDYVPIERDYFRRTGIFPIMHTVVVTRRLLDEHPDTVQAVYRAFGAAKDLVVAEQAQQRVFNHMTVQQPWLSALYDDNQQTFGGDPWPHGIAANRPAIEAALRLNHDQGVTSRRFAIEEVFVPSLLDT